MRILVFSIAMFAAFTMASVGSTQAEMITLTSGLGVTPGAGTDSAITFALGPVSTGFGFGALPFAAADVGSNPNVIVPHPDWAPSGTVSPTANWISNATSGTATGNTVLYAMDFTVTTASIGSATLDFTWLSDNGLGDDSGPGLTGNEGLYINGMAVTGTRLFSATDSAMFDTTQTFLGLDVSSLLVTGTNTLYVNAVNFGGPAGVQFSGEFNITAVPEPTSLVMFGLALVGLSRRRR